MIANRLVAFFIELGGGGFLLWLWYDAGKTGVLHSGFFSFKRSQSRRAFEAVRWFILATAAVIFSFGVYILFAAHPFFESQS